MNRIILSTLAGLAIATLSCAAELEDVAAQFVAAATAGDSEKLTDAYLDSPKREKAVEAFMEVLPQIQAKKLKVTRVDKELVIGDLGVTLVRLDFDGHPEANYQPLICVRVDARWRIFPWASEADLKVLLEQRTPDEQIHLKLFNTWANLTEELIKKEAEQDGGAKGD